MRASLLVLVLLVLAVVPSRAQSAQSDLAPVIVSESGAYAVPFASEGNVLELAVVNTAVTAVEEVAVTVAEAPAWLVLEPVEVVLEGLIGGAEVPVSFTFSVGQEAPVGEVAVLRFAITAQGALLGEKEIHLQVEAPRAFALHGNYPNPFNPITRLGYTLPQASKVSLRIYDVLGREVAHLVEEERGAGYHEAVWEAGRYASGVYIYRLMAEDEAGGRTVRQRTMLLLK